MRVHKKNTWIKELLYSASYHNIIMTLIKKMKSEANLFSGTGLVQLSLEKGNSHT